jgi:hypothetical protein
MQFNIPGASPSTPDYRDHKEEPTMDVPTPVIWDTDLSSIPIYNQQKIGLCTGASLTTVVEYLYYKRTGVFVKLSRRFLYSVTKNMIDQNQIEGSSCRSALKAAYDYGICTEAALPSDPTGMTHEQFIDINAIPAGAFAEAKNYQIGGYISVPTDPTSLSAAIYKYGLLYSRVECGPTWWQDAQGVNSWDPEKINPLRYPSVIVSGHAIVEKGFDPSFLTLRNSWSAEWCKQGDADRSITGYAPTESWAVTLKPIVNDLPAAGTFHHLFLTLLAYGDRSDEVRNLQIALMIGGDLPYVQPIDRGYYGVQTQAAVYKYQLRKKIPLSWIEKYIYKGRYCGPKTLAALTADFRNK